MEEFILILQLIDIGLCRCTNQSLYGTGEFEIFNGGMRPHQGHHGTHIHST